MKTKKQLLDELTALEERVSKKQAEIKALEEKERKALADEILPVIFKWQDENGVSNEKLVSSLKKALSSPPAPSVKAKKATARPKAESSMPAPLKEENEPKPASKLVKNSEPAAMPDSTKALKTRIPSSFANDLKLTFPGISKEDIALIHKAILASENNIVVDLQMRFALKDRANDYLDTVKSRFHTLKALAR